MIKTPPAKPLPMEDANGKRTKELKIVYSHCQQLTALKLRAFGS